MVEYTEKIAQKLANTVDELELVDNTIIFLQETIVHTYL